LDCDETTQARAFSVRGPLRFPADGVMEAWWKARSDWANKYWGTISNAWDFQAADKAGRYECSFNTKWSPPIPIWKKIGEMFPTLEIAIEGQEEMAQYAFRGSIRNGKLELRDVPVMAQAIDPKTGKAVTGTYNEIMKMLQGTKEIVGFSTWAGE